MPDALPPRVAADPMHIMRAVLCRMAAHHNNWTVRQTVILLLLTQPSAPPFTRSRLAQRMNINIPAVGRAIASLVTRELVEFVPGSRGDVVRATAAGRHYVEGLQDLVLAQLQPELAA